MIHRIIAPQHFHTYAVLLRLILLLAMMATGKFPLGAVMQQPVSLELEAAARYRRRAGELRAIASTHKNPETNRILDAVARDYDRMAETLEMTQRTQQTVRCL